MVKDLKVKIGSDVVDGIYQGTAWATKVNVNFTNEKELEELVSCIMVNDGPDGHSDGSNVIAQIIWARIEELKHV